jgi:hypothetical protein
MLKLVLIASLLFPDVHHGESPATQEQRRAAFALIRQGKIEEALPDLRFAAEKNDRLALYQLGVMYEVGKGVAQNYDLAWDCWSKSAGQGLLAANHQLGRCYFYGWHVEQSEQKAKQYWLRGANNGFAPSQYLLATTSLSLHSKDTTPENVEAVRWLLKAARQDLPEAICVLGILYEIGFGVKKDLQLACALEQRSLAKQFEVEPNMKPVARTILDRVARELSALGNK